MYKKKRERERYFVTSELAICVACWVSILSIVSPTKASRVGKGLLGGARAG